MRLASLCVAAVMISLSSPLIAQNCSGGRCSSNSRFTPLDQSRPNPWYDPAQAPVDEGPPSGYDRRENQPEFGPTTRADGAAQQRLCPVTGEELGSMGEPIPVTVMGQTISVCCQACVRAVKRDPQKYIQIVQNELQSQAPAPSRILAPPARVAQQRLCPVTGEELGSMGKPIPVTVMGQTISVCCQACVRAVNRDPQKYLQIVRSELQSQAPAPPRILAPLARAAQQRLCPVMGEELGTMGRPIPVMAQGGTIYVCCQDCVEAVSGNPARYRRLVDQELRQAEPESENIESSVFFH